MARVPKKLGKYRIRRRIAEGQFATVYEAYDTIEGLTLALKVPFDQAPSEREELAREVRMMASLNNPHILPIKSATIEDGKFVIAYRLGKESLYSRMGRRMSHRNAMSIAEDILDAVAYAHEHRIVHRDIKPENIIMFEDGRACLADFGIAKIALKTRTASYDGTGTYGYMAPEHALGKATFRSDVFSTGLVLWRLLGGSLPDWPFSFPFEGHTRIRRAFGAPIVEVLRKSLLLDDRKRYANGRRMLEAFKKAKREATRKTRPLRTTKAGNGSWRATRLKEFKRAVRKELGEVSGCQNCSGPIAEAMANCPWCGVKVHWYEGPSTFASRCERCNRGVKRDWEYCTWCYGGRIGDEGSTIRSDKRYVRRCQSPGCGQRVLLPFARYCPSCRTRVKTNRTRLAGSAACRACGWAVFPGSWDYCPWCGKSCGA